MANEQMSFADRSKLVDINDKGLFTGETVQLNYEADAWEIPAPPPMGSYDLKLFPAKEFLKMVMRDETKGWDSPSNVYYMANLECRIVAPGKDWDGNVVFSSVNTQLYRGRELSTMMGLVKLCGVTPKVTSLNDLQQAQILAKVLKSEPIVRGVFLDWQAYSKNDKKNVCNSMTDFPKNQDGTYQHSFTYTDSQRAKEDLNAQIRVKSWTGVVGSPSNNGASVPKATQAVSAHVAPPPPAPAPSVDDELANLLA